MQTRPFCLTDAQVSELSAAFVHTQHADTKIRYQAVRLYGTGYSVEQINTICGCTTRSLLRWAKRYRTDGITALLDHRAGGNRAVLSAQQIETVQNQLHTYTPAQLLGRGQCQGEGAFWTVADLVRLLERDYGVTYRSATSVRKLLKECGFSFQRPAKQYKSHSDEKIADFEERLEKKS